jgi:hypothetical protein
MKVRIKKNVLGEEYLFYVFLTYKSNICKVRIAVTDTEYSAKINDDFTKVILDEPLPLKGYGEAIPLASGNGSLAGYGKSKTKNITFLKIDRYNKGKFRDNVLGL